MEQQRIYGLNNEQKIIDYLNGKRIDELNNKWKHHILKIFPNASLNSVIHAKHYPDTCSKPDMILENSGEEKFISIKTGHCPSVHHESYFSFQRFLKRIGVKIRTLQIIRFYHYGDSKKLGIKDKPLTSEELKSKFMPYFLEASQSLDRVKIIKAIVNRTIIVGTSVGRASINYLYYGDLEHGNLLSVDEIYAIILSNRKHGIATIHFGALSYMPSTRKVGCKDRNYVRIKWPMLSYLFYANDEDIEKMKKGTFAGLSSKDEE